MTTTRQCPQCGAPLAENEADGLCSRCFLNAGMAASRAPAPAGVEQLEAALPRYEILQDDGDGMYRARDRESGRIVALQVVEDPGDGFAAQAAALARLEHPHLARVHDSGEAGCARYLAADYVEGRRLSQVRLQPREALRVVEQVCGALGYAHDEGVSLGRVRPDAIRVDAQGRARVTALGLQPGRLDVRALADVIFATLTGQAPATAAPGRPAAPAAPPAPARKRELVARWRATESPLRAAAIAGAVVVVAGFLPWLHYSDGNVSGWANGWEAAIQYNGQTLLPNWLAVVTGMLLGGLAVARMSGRLDVSWKVFVGGAGYAVLHVLAWIIFLLNADVPDRVRLNPGFGAIVSLLAFGVVFLAGLRMRPAPARPPRPARRGSPGARRRARERARRRRRP